MTSKLEEKRERINALIEKRKTIADEVKQRRQDNPGQDILRRLLQSPKVQKTILDYLSKEETADSGSGLFTTSTIKKLGLDKLESFDDFSTSSTTKEILRYKNKLINRASWLESIFEETLRELEKIDEFLENKKPSKE